MQFQAGDSATDYSTETETENEKEEEMKCKSIITRKIYWLGVITS